MQATTNQNDWGREIRAKSSEKHSNSTPWVSVTMPDDPALGGKTVGCDVVLGVEYPEVTGSSDFQTVARKMDRNLTLQLAATPGAGRSYDSWWWEGTVGGMVLLLVCALIWWACRAGCSGRRIRRDCCRRIVRLRRWGETYGPGILDAGDWRLILAVMPTEQPPTENYRGATSAVLPLEYAHRPQTSRLPLGGAGPGLPGDHDQLYRSAW